MSFNLKKFRFTDMYLNYFKSFAVLSLIAFLGYNLILFGFLYIKQLHTSRNTSADIALKSTAILDSYLTESYNVINNCITNTNVMTFLEMDTQYVNDINEIRKQYRIINHIQSLLQPLKNVDDIYVFSEKSNYIISSKDSGTEEKFAKTAWFERLYAANGVFTAFTQYDRLFICQKIHDLGWIIVKTKTDKFSDLIKNGSFFIIYGDYKDPVYASDAAFPADINLEALSANSAAESYGILKHGGFYYIQTSSQYWFTYIFKIKINLFSSSIGYYITFAAGGILFLLVLLYLSYIQTSKTYYYISEIMGILNSDSEENSAEYNEWVYISNKLISIMNQNMTFRTALREKLAELKRVQGVALQLQINPHFLFNTLYIAVLSIQKEIKGDCKGTKMITLLSEILQLVLNTRENIITLEQELLYSQKYIELEKLKYDNQLEVQWEIESECMDFKLPKFILQPILENSIMHGICDEDQKLNIHILAQKKNDSMHIEIKDNGAGMSADKLHELKDLVQSREFHENRHIGIPNIVKRLSLLYADDYVFDITSKPQQGTCVTIELPLF